MDCLLASLRAAAEPTHLRLLSLGLESGVDRLLDIGTGTDRVLELLAPRISQGVGVDASKAMLALARARLARARLSHCSVRFTDCYSRGIPPFHSGGT